MLEFYVKLIFSLVGSGDVVVFKVVESLVVVVVVVNIFKVGVF